MWGNWSEFSLCNQSCGYGYERRIRKCDKPSAAYGGMECPGPRLDQRKGCNPQLCPGNSSFLNQLRNISMKNK